jgi:hypothetical protein
VCSPHSSTTGLPDAPRCGWTPAASTRLSR